MTKAFKKIIKLTGKAIGDYDLIQEGDNILVGLSGGKDSWSLLYSLIELRKKAPVSFYLCAAVIDPGFPEEPVALMKTRLQEIDIPHDIIPGNIIEVVNENLTSGTNPCSFCSRLRRGILYTYARRNKYNKLALGHHLDDFIETFLLNSFYNGSIKAMSPNLLADNGEIRVIRPLVYVRETLTRQSAHDLAVPIFGCDCAYQGMSQTRRHWVKGLINQLEREIPDIRSNLLSSLGRVHYRHLLVKNPKPILE